MPKCAIGCTCRKHLSKPFTAERRAKISASKMGHTVSAEARAKIGAASRGRIASEETRQKMSAAGRRHGWGGRGDRRTPVYRTWDGMIQRCTNPNNLKWPTYGGRGITVCERWRSFESFLADMGDRPPGMSLDRIDNSRGYEPGNCRWATASVQQKNRRPRAPHSAETRAKLSAATKAEWDRKRSAS